MYVNGKELATEDYADSKANAALSSAKSYTNNHVVNGAHIANGAVTTNKIANGAITEDKLASDLKAQIKNSGNQVVSTCNAQHL